MALSLGQILQSLAMGEPLELGACEQLSAQLLADEPRAKAFGVTGETAQDVVNRQAKLFPKVYLILVEVCQSRFSPASPWLETLWNLWMPLALRLIDTREAIDRPLVQGILGGQGTGKTTLGIILTRILQACGYQTLSFSLDDLYKPHADRLQLRDRDPRLRWRGPPGTHDVELGMQVLDRLRNPGVEEAIAIPRFDKSLHHGSGDRIAPELVSAIDIILFEGWFVGVRPIDPILFDTAPNPIITIADKAFARDMNAQLRPYLPLWERLDRLMVLHPADYRWSRDWRKQAEQEMAASGKSGMSDAEIDAFVEYFWKTLHPELFIQPLITCPGLTDLVIEIQADHQPGAVYRPEFL